MIRTGPLSGDSAANVPSAAANRQEPPGVAPHVQLIQMAVAIWEARAVYAAAHLGLPDLLAEGPRSTEWLAQASGTRAPSLFRLLRALASCGLLHEERPGVFANATLGAALRTGATGAARATILTLAGDWQWKAWDLFLDSLRTGETGLGRAFGCELFDYLAANPSYEALFNEAMVGMHGAVAPAVVNAYDFSRFASIVDVGGGTGRMIATILRANECLHGVLFEQPKTARQARDFLGGSDVATRCKVVEGNFFDAVPSGHDAYVLAHVLHDWNDDQSIAILRNCRSAIATGGRVLIIEAVLPAGDTPHHGKMMDLLMLTVTGGRERTGAEFAAVLAAAGFRLNQVVSTSTHQSIIEAIPT